MKAHSKSELCLLYSLRNKTKGQEHQISRACAVPAVVSIQSLSKLIWPILSSMMTASSCTYCTYYTFQNICEILQKGYNAFLLYILLCFLPSLLSCFLSLFLGNGRNITPELAVGVKHAFHRSELRRSELKS